MSFWSGSYKLQPGYAEDIGRLGGLAGRVRQWGEGVGLGAAGKSAKKLIKGFGSGNFDNNPVFESFFNPIRNQTAVAMGENERRARMGVNALVPGQQAGLLNAQTNVANERAQRTGALAMQDMLPALYGQATNTFAQARGQKLGAQESAFGQEADIEGAIQRARQAGTYKTGGFLGALGKIGAIAGPLAGALIPGLGPALGAASKVGSIAGRAGGAAATGAGAAAGRAYGY